MHRRQLSKCECLRSAASHHGRQRTSVVWRFKCSATLVAVALGLVIMSTAGEHQGLPGWPSAKTNQLKFFSAQSMSVAMLVSGLYCAGQLTGFCHLLCH